MANRFYKHVSVKAVDRQPRLVGEHNEKTYGVFLDDRELKTPGKHPLHVTNKAHAEIIAREWDAQSETIEPHKMPATRLANVALEQTPKNREQVINEGCNYARSDLLCYRADGPAVLSERQDALWGPWVAWAEGQGIALNVTTSIIAIPQDEASIMKVKARLEAMDNLDLTLCVHFIAVFGSAILGLAVLARDISAADAFELSRLDAIWQSEQWGVDEEAQRTAAALREDIMALSEFII